MAPPSAVELILKKRDGKELTEEEIVWFVNQFTAGEIPDYQCSAFLMAVCLKDMTDKDSSAYPGHGEKRLGRRPLRHIWTKG